MTNEPAPPSPYLFTTKRRTPTSAAGFRKQLAVIGVAAELLFPVHPHMLRHACGFAFANGRHDTRVIQEGLGHRDIQHTTRYTELTTHRFKEFPSRTRAERRGRWPLAAWSARVTTLRWAMAPARMPGAGMERIGRPAAAYRPEPVTRVRSRCCAPTSSAGRAGAARRDAAMLGNLDWRWIAIGAAVMVGLNVVASLILVLLIGDRLPATATDAQDAAAALGGGQLALGALIGIASFAVGGYIVGVKSPGRTILEPGLSAAIAVVIGLLLGGAFTLGNLLLGGLVPFLAGLLGGYLGERRQGRTAAGSRSSAG